MEECSEQVFACICTVKDEKDKTETPYHEYDNPSVLVFYSNLYNQ